ncbi:hypothetical protein JCM17478_28280 [Thermopirellula anaerolimosa]
MSRKICYENRSIFSYSSLMLAKSTPMYPMLCGYLIITDAAERDRYVYLGNSTHISHLPDFHGQLFHQAFDEYHSGFHRSVHVGRLQDVKLSQVLVRPRRLCPKTWLQTEHLAQVDR